MKKISIILDSLCANKEEEVLKQGFHFLPQTINIDGKEFEDGVNITFKENKSLIENAKSFSTSMPSIGKVNDLFEKLSKESENVVFLPMNKGISSTFSSAKAASSSFPNVHVINTKLVGEQILIVAKHIEKMANKGKSIEEIIEIIEEISKNATTYVIPKKLDALVKSGRLKGIRKIILQAINIVPKLYFGENGFVPISFRRNFKKMLILTIENFIKKNNMKNYDAFIFSTLNEETDKIAEDEFKKLKIPFFKNAVPLVVAAHSGDGAIGIGFLPKIK